MRAWRRRPPLRRSLRLRLLLLFLGLALATVLVFTAGMQHALSGSWRALLRPLVADYVDRLAAELGTPPDPARAAALVQRLPVSVRIEGPVVRYDSHPGRPWRGHDSARDSQDDEFDGDSDGESGWLLARRTADGHRVTFGLGQFRWQHQPRAVGWVTLAALLLLTAAAYLYVQRLLRPLDDIRSGAVRFGQGNFGTPIPVRRADELGDLAAQVNAMAADISRMLDAKRGLLLAISHELRSPLTRARLNAELVQGGSERNALLRDLAEMRDLVDDLLESERLAGGHVALQREPTDLNALVAELLDSTADAADAMAPERALAPALPLLPLDRMRMRLLLRNLLDNAGRHGGGAQRPSVSTALVDGHAVLQVRDFGPGVDEAHIAHLAEAFYRPDVARARGAGGVGLGLHLCRLIVQAHGGRLVIRNAVPGLAVRVELPVPGSAGAADGGNAVAPRAPAR